MRILLVEDEKDMAVALTAALERHDILVDHAPTLEIAEQACRNRVHDAVLLDRKLPDGDGLSLIPLIRRERGGVPVIVVSALISHDNGAGLDHGADDYLAKPFSTDELLAKLRAVMPVPARLGGQSIVNVGRLRFNLTEGRAEVGGEPLQLTRRELLALEVLVRRSGRTVSSSALAAAVDGNDDETAAKSLDSHIAVLRHKLISSGVEIHDIHGLGYLLRAAP